MKFEKYSKIPNLYRPEAQSIFDLEEVVVTEKLDGTNCSFGLIDNVPVINSRNHNFYNRKFLPSGIQENHIKQFDGYGIKNKFFEVFSLGIFDELEWLKIPYIHSNGLVPYRPFENSVLIYGEFFGEGVQNRIDYGPGKHFAFFDAKVDDQWLDWDSFLLLCKTLNLPTVPELYRGPPFLDKLEEYLGRPSELSPRKDLPEGIVIKGLKNETNKWGERIIAKYKNEKFSEKVKGPKSKKQTKFDLNNYNTQLAQQYVNQSRLENILEKLRSENKPISMKITGDVVKRMVKDVSEDLLEEEKNHFEFIEKHFNKTVGALAAQLYKDFLRERMKNRAKR